MTEPGDGAEPAPAPLQGADAPVVVDPGNAAGGRVTAHVHLISVALLARGGTPLVSQAVEVVDPDTGALVCGPLHTDDQGRLLAQVPEDRAYAVRIVDDDQDGAAAPLEGQPAPDGDGVRLYLQLLTPEGTRLGGAAYELRGVAPLDFTLKGQAGADGELEVDGCPPGAYDLTVNGQALRVHALFDSDFTEDTAPYQVLVGGTP